MVMFYIDTVHGMQLSAMRNLGSIEGFSYSRIYTSSRVAKGVFRFNASNRISQRKSWHR